MATTQALEALIAEWEGRDIPRPTRRDVVLPSLAGRADAVIGMRRSGKTWLLFQRMHELLDSGVPRSQVLFANLEDDRLAPLAPGDLAALLDAFRRRRPDSIGRPTHLFLDEIQNAPEWFRFVRRVLDTEPATRVVISGSSARMLAREVHTSLRGRSLATEVLPFSFREWLRHRSIAPPTRMPPPPRDRAVLENAFDSYLAVGGFPEVQGLEDGLRSRVLQDYVDAVLLRDVIERHSVTQPVALRRLARRLLASPGGTFSVSRFHRELTSSGVSVAKNTLHDLLGHLQDAFLVFLVEVDSRSEKRRTVNPRKCYPVDPGLAAAVSSRAQVDVGHRLECAVFLELRRRGFDVTYHMTASRREVDFVARGADGNATLFQVCLDLSDPETRRRELAALAEALGERKGADAVVVTLRGEETVDVRGRGVRVVPAWRWCLEAEGV